ncbi:MAG: hypothetical protein J0M24_05055 [Verrucomicrobia bacterium]|nr:hypothetical protein [Verrucomicrobiota bacterium]
MLPRITDRQELVAVVQRVMDVGYTDEEMVTIMDLLVRSTGCPHVSDLIFWPKLPMTAEQVVDAALAYRPIILGAGHGIDG